MKSIATYFLGYLVAHILLISIVQSIFCQDLKILGLALIFVAFGIAVFNSKKIILEKSDIIIVFLFVFLNIYYKYIDLKGFIFFNMTYVQNIWNQFLAGKESFRERLIFARFIMFCVWHKYNYISLK